MFKSISIVSTGSPSTLVLGYFKDAKLDKASASRDIGGVAAAALTRTESTGDLGTVSEAYPATKAGSKNAITRIMLVGLGAKDKFESGSMRAVAAAIGRRCVANKETGMVEIDLSGALGEVKKFDAEAGAQSFGEGLGLLGWVCDHFKGTGQKEPIKRLPLKVKVAAGDVAQIKRGVAIAESANFCRTLSQTPPNVATTGWMAQQAVKMARQTGLKVKIFEGADLEREKFEGLINVGKASENKPCMIRLEYRPAGGGRGKPAILVGKTMTYDTGGLSLKINNGMVGMKRDKDGGCAVLGAMHAIATVIKPKRPVIALLAVAENSISDEAYRPDDVLTYRNGVTVEVTNTDAEGRLVLADALCWACEKENPAYIIDLATLTGGVVVALGSTYAGMFCEDDNLRAKLEQASKASGERVWRLPMHEEYRELMKSPIADILNSNPNRKAHPIQGAAFLSYFVKENIPWCHLDIAGVHATESNKGMFVDGPTGWGTRLLAAMLDAE
ncbi:MAG: leucyl aminopeptidase family protein [Planctomycetes bacterium]|nr:leucyl aminopeptidase family protein [Planctomycetota bacterium]